MTDDADIGAQLASWGTVALVETQGRVSGRPARAAVGYLEEPDGSLLVAAGDPDADWARNLEADPTCLVTIGERAGPFLAEPLDGTERNAAIAGLILRYGTPAERLGRGPAFRLRPSSAGPATGR
ncbi:MAG TPA: nitroreductase family deazaflavin-dependent oxidoreductase [Candidatus Limnocylindrales bacterium]|nr:nitroreductase family deazaflavin-dependent oxidoreductase [Candidatus Limnocylindrales bacterium]